MTQGFDRLNSRRLDQEIEIITRTEAQKLRHSAVFGRLTSPSSTVPAIKTVVSFPGVDENSLMVFVSDHDGWEHR